MQTLLKAFLAVTHLLALACPRDAVFLQEHLEALSPLNIYEIPDLASEPAEFRFWFRCLPALDQHQCSVTTKQLHRQWRARHHLLIVCSHACTPVGVGEQ